MGLCLFVHVLQLSNKDFIQNRLLNITLTDAILQFFLWAVLKTVLQNANKGMYSSLGFETLIFN